MPLSAQIVVRNVRLPAGLRDRIEARVEKLEGFFGGIRACSVTVEGPGPHHHHGRHAVRVTLSVPRRTLVVTRQSDVSPEIAVREAFAAADRRLEDHARRVRRA